MRAHFSALAFVTAACFFGLSAPPADAQATRTWVSGVGNDADPCSRTAPCKTFGGTINKTAAGGEINCLDSGAFGSVTITKSLTINCVGHVGGVLATGLNGIIVNAAATDRVTLRGLDIEGAVTGFNGIRIIGAGTVHVQDTTIRNFRGAAPNGNGIFAAPTGALSLFVADTAITDHLIGILIQPTGGGSVKAVVERVQVEANGVGIEARMAGVTGAGANVTISSSVIAGSTGRGIAAIGGGGAPLNIMVDDSSVASNGGTGIFTSGNNANTRVGNTNITGNNAPMNVSGGGQNFSYGNNRINANANAGDAPTVIQES